MAPSGTQTVFGFGPGLDWRPTVFVNPFPSTSVCSACGFVPCTVATLPCRHFLCQPCYDRSAGKHGHCPLDMEPVKDENVVWSSTSKDSVLGRKVRCWNAGNGCEVEDAASTMLEHFGNACEFHAASCPRCGDKMPHRDVPNHLESGCTPSSSREQPLGDNLVNAVLEVKGALGKLAKENARLHTKLDSFQEHFVVGSSAVALPTTSADTGTAIVDISSASRAATEAAIAKEASSQVKQAVACTEEAIKKAVSEECDRQIQAFREKIPGAAAGGQKVVDAAFAFVEELAKKQALKEKGETRPMELLAAVFLCMTSDVLALSLPYSWTITNWDELCAKKDAPREYFASIQGEASYHLGYLIVPELCYSKPADMIWFRVHVLRGLFDKLLKWPMRKKLQVCFGHPTYMDFQYTYTSGFEWMTQADTLSSVTKQVVATGYSQTFFVRELTERYIFYENKNRSVTMKIRFVS